MRCTLLGPALLAATVLGVAATAQQAPDIPVTNLATDLATDVVARMVQLREGLFPERRALLAELRRAALARPERANTDAIITALRTGSASSQAAWSRWLAERGGELVQSFWIVPAATVRVPSSGRRLRSFLSTVMDFRAMSAATAVYSGMPTNRGTSSNATLRFS